MEHVDICVSRVTELLRHTHHKSYSCNGAPGDTEIAQGGHVAIVAGMACPFTGTVVTRRDGVDRIANHEAEVTALPFSADFPDASDFSDTATISADFSDASSLSHLSQTRMMMTCQVDESKFSIHAMAEVNKTRT